MHQLAFLDRILEGLDAVAAEGVVLRQRGDCHARAVNGDGIADRILAGIAAGTEDVLVPLVTGDRVGHGRLDQQDLLVLLGHGQHGQRHARSAGPHGDVGLVIRVGRGQLALAQIGLALVVFLYHHQLLAGHRHAAARGVFQAHHQAGLGLLAIGLERAGLAVDVGNADFARLREGGLAGQQGQRSQGSGMDQSTALHGACLL
ncbi:hypothetical protein D3C78_1106860 [compost metagenome]